MQKLVTARDIKPGTIIGFKYGAMCGTAIGIAYGRIPSKLFGDQCRVKFPDGTFTTVMASHRIDNPDNLDAESLLYRAEHGIGSYILTPAR